MLPRPVRSLLVVAASCLIGIACSSSDDKGGGTDADAGPEVVPGITSSGEPEPPTIGDAGHDGATPIDAGKDAAPPVDGGVDAAALRKMVEAMSVYQFGGTLPAKGEHGATTVT